MNTPEENPYRVCTGSLNRDDETASLVSFQESETNDNPQEEQTCATTASLKAQQLVQWVGEREAACNDFQQFCFVPAAFAIVQGAQTAKSLLETIGYIAVISNFLWDISTSLYGISALPRLYAEKKGGGAIDAFLFYSVALTHPFLGGAIIAYLVTGGEKVTKDLWVKSEINLSDKNSIIYSNITYAVCMCLWTMKQARRSQLAIEDKFLFRFGVVRDGACAIGAILSAISTFITTLELQCMLNYVSASFYLFSCLLNAGELLERKTTVFSSAIWPTLCAGYRSTQQGIVNLPSNIHAFVNACRDSADRAATAQSHALPSPAHAWV